MNESTCLSKMIAPGMRRPGIWREGVLQIWITRACDRACPCCTQNSQLGGSVAPMTREQFETAVKSLQGYFGVVGVFGGNPTLHPRFTEICEILSHHVPFEQRGLWSNHPRGKGKICRETFNPAVSNLNTHQDQAAEAEWKRDWPECRLIGTDTDSRHSPHLISMIDVNVPEGDRWDLISRCTINQTWSAMIGVFRGELRAWVCEIMGSHSIAHQHEPDYPDTGLVVEPGWWERPMRDFADQVRYHCHRCSIPLNLKGPLANGGSTEFVSSEHLSICRPKRKGRDVVLVTDLSQLDGSVELATDYLGNAAGHE